MGSESVEKIPPPEMVDFIGALQHEMGGFNEENFQQVASAAMAFQESMEGVGQTGLVAEAAAIGTLVLVAIGLPFVVLAGTHAAWSMLDSDGDGVRNELDKFPNDADKALCPGVGLTMSLPFL